MSEQQAMEAGWKQGPLPPGTSGWGGVVTVKMVKGRQTGFRFADFRGDHVVCPCTKERIEADQIAFYNNTLTCPTYEEHAKPVLTGVLGLMTAILPWFFFLVLVAATLGCSQTPPDMSGFASTLVVTTQPSDLPSPDDEGCDNNDCNGTGVITHGDGHTSKCPCERCECRKGGGQPASSFMLPPTFRHDPQSMDDGDPDRKVSQVVDPAKGKSWEDLNPDSTPDLTPVTPDLDELAQKSVPTPYAEAYKQALSESRPMVVILEGTEVHRQLDRALDIMSSDLPPGYILTTFPAANSAGGYFTNGMTILYPRGGRMVKGPADFRGQSGAKPQTRSR